MKDCREFDIPCGQCIGCRIERRDAWAFRCYAESRLHKKNCFLTLTYDDEHLPADNSLNHRDWQLFAKRLRDKAGPFRYFMCGEYGEKKNRAHYHALLFGFDFDDKYKSNSMYSKHDLYRSGLLEETWGKGQCSIGEVTYASARYCAVYTTKIVDEERWKETGYWVDSYGEMHERKQPYGRMSLKPGIGAEWFRKYWPEAVAWDGVHVQNRKQKIPKYFNEMLKELSPDDSDELSKRRKEKAGKFSNEQTRKRLEIREVCAHAKRAFNQERYGNEV